MPKKDENISFFIRKIPRNVHAQFKAACASMDETMTTAIKRMMKRYVAQVEGRRSPNSTLLKAAKIQEDVE